MYEWMMSDSMFGLFLQVVPITCLVGLIYALLRYRCIKRRGWGVVWGTELARLVFVCYLTGLINLVLVPNNLWTAIWFYLFNGYGGCTVGHLFEFNFNVVPTVYRYLIGELAFGGWVTAMLIGNVTMFVPMGVLLPFVSKRVTGRTMVPLAIAIPIVVELLQPIIGRSFDIDDVLGNFFGILIGYAAAAAVKYMWNYCKKK